MHGDVAVQLRRGVVLEECLQIGEIAVMPLSPGAHHADIHKSEILITVVTFTQCVEQTLAVFNKQWVV